MSRTKNLNFPEGNGEQLIYWPYTNQIGSLQSSRGACLHPESSGSADVSVSVESINKHLSLAPLVKTKRMMLVLDLDHTLINSTNLEDLSSDKGYLLHQISTKKDEGLLHSIEFVDCPRLVKLRPFVRQFLKEANNIFDLYVYTTGTRGYAT